MATVTYAWIEVVDDFFVNLTAQGAQTAPSITALNEGTSYFALWNSIDFIGGRNLNAAGVPSDSSDVFISPQNHQVNNPSFGSITQLVGGNIVVTFTHIVNTIGPIEYSDISASIFNSAGTSTGIQIPVAATALLETDSDVTALADGGFVVSYTRYLSEDNDPDILAKVYNADGTLRAAINVDDDAYPVSGSQVVGLNNGSFVVVWNDLTKGAEFIQVYYAIYDAAGATVVAPKPLDEDKQSNQSDIQIVALQDGGFAVTYTDDGTLAGEGADITTAIFNADGTARSGPILTNTATADDQLGQAGPTISILSNGYIIVGWHDGDVLNYQAYTPAGLAVGSNFVIANDVIEGEIAGLGGGLIANVHSSLVADSGGDESIRSSVHALVRTTSGNWTSEVLSGDNLRDVIFGNGGNDTLNGFGGDDTLYGGNGADMLNGGTGADAMFGGKGSDTYVVNDVGDTVSEGRDGGIDTVRSEISYTLGGNIENLYLLRAAAIDGTGNGLANLLVGNVGDNSLYGLAGRDQLSGDFGSDTLYGGTGNDVLSGGAGPDRFVFDTTLNSATNVDVIMDFLAGVDEIWLDHDVFTQIAATGLMEAAFYTGSGAHDADDRIIYNSATGALAYDADGNGAGRQVVFAQLGAGLALTYADFFVI